MWTRNKPRQRQDLTLVSFLRQRLALHDRSATQQISELIVQLSNSCGSKGTRDANNKFLPHPASGMVYAIKSRDLVHGRVYVVKNLEEMKVSSETKPIL
jgi:hypothetical protein